MSRILRAAAAQMGPIHRADRPPPPWCERLIALLRQAGRGRLPSWWSFPELTLTTFFPRWWMTDQAEIDAFFETRAARARRPGRSSRRRSASASASTSATRSSPKKAARDPALQHLGPGRARRPRPRQVPQGASARPRRAQARGALPAPGEALLRRRRPGLSGLAQPSAPWSACASATTGAGPRPSGSWACRASELVLLGYNTPGPQHPLPRSRSTCACSTTA